MSNRIACEMIGTQIDYRPAHGFPCAATRSIANGLDVVVRRCRAASDQRVTGLSACTACGSKYKTRGLMPTGGRNKPRMIFFQV